MSSSLSKTLSKVFATILLSVLIVSFAIFGTGPGLLSSSSTNVAITGDIKISPQRFVSRVQNRAAEIQAQSQLDMDTTTLITTFGLDYQVLQQMVGEAQIAAHAKAMGLAANDSDIAEVLQQVEAFKEPGAGFNEYMMRQTLASNGLSVDDFLATVEENIVSSQIISAFADAELFPLYATEKLYTFDAERRQASLMNFSTSELEDPADPGDEILAPFFEGREDDFKSPAQRSYNYILITPELYRDQVTVTEDDIEAVYADRLEEFVTPEERTILQVTVADEAAGAALAAAVAGGQTFTEAATSLTDFGADELSIGSQTQEELTESYGADVAASVFTAPEQTVIGPIATTLGFTSMFFVTEIDPGSEKSITDVRERLEYLATTEKAVDLMYDALPDIEDAVLSDGALDAVAERLNLTLASVPLVDRNGLTTDGRRVTTLPEETRILSIAFATDEGAEPEQTAIDTTNDDKGFFFVELTEVREPAVQELSAVRSRVLELWRLNEKRKVAGETAEKAQEMLNAGLSPETIINDLGGTSYDANNIARVQSDSVAGRISPTIRRLIFDLGIGETGIEQSGDGYVVVKVNEVTPGNPQGAAGEVAARQDAFKRAFIDDLFVQYQQYLNTRFPPEINQQLVDQLFRNPVQQQLP